MAAAVEQPAESPVPLPRGRHRLSREEVRASQRKRLIRAMLDEVHTRGYDRTTVADVVAAARTSRNAFYELFEDRRSCFIAACDELQHELLQSMFEQAVEPDWISALSTGLDIYLDTWASRPGFAVAYFMDLPSAGRPAMEQRDRAYVGFEQMFVALAERARTEQPDLPELAPLVPRILVTTITELVAQEVRAGRGTEIAGLRGGLLRFIVLMLSDERTAQGLDRRPD